MTEFISTTTERAATEFVRIQTSQDRETEHTHVQRRLPLIGGLAVLFVVALLHANVVHAGDWGDLTGRVIFNGPAPVRLALELNKDTEFCGRSKPLDESLIVDPETRGLANVVVMLDAKRGSDLPGIHPDYERTANTAVRVTNRGCRFEPRISIMRLGQKLLLENDDAIAHNTLANLTYNQPFNEAVARGQTIEKLFTRAETKPAEITCPIHAWMKGYIIIKDHPYVAVTDSKGRFTISNLPPGEWKFQFWHESSKFMSRVELGGQKFDDRKGLYSVVVRAGKNELGDVLVEPELFQ